MGIAKAHGGQRLSEETQAQVGVLRSQGMSCAEVAERLNISLTTAHLSGLQPVKPNYTAIRDHRLMLKQTWKPGRYMLCQDAHVPFHSLPALEQCIATKGDFDGCIFAGDLMDFYKMSSFLKDMKITMKQEVEQANVILERLAKRFGRVLFFKGNHEERGWKLIRKAAESMILKGGEFGDEIAPEVYSAAKRVLALHNSQLNCMVHDD